MLKRWGRKEDRFNENLLDSIGSFIAGVRLAKKKGFRIIHCKWSCTSKARGRCLGFALETECLNSLIIYTKERQPSKWLENNSSFELLKDYGEL